MDPALQELFAEGAPDDEVAVVIRLVQPDVVPDGVRLVTRFGDIATCRVRRSDILQLHASEKVKSVKAPRKYAPGEVVQFDDDLVPTATDIRRPPGLAATGRGALLCHVDWGADFTANDFRLEDGRTRFRAIWDQGAAYDPAHPNRYGYGRIYRTADIDRALAQPDPFKALGYDSATAAPAGGSHGSHTLGISGGNGRSGAPSGMAPEADLAFVDLSTRHEIGLTGLGDSAAFLEALDFFAELANERGLPQPLIVNASLGRQCGQHDGKTLTELGMDQFLLAAPGRAICQSAGNYFDQLMHTQGTLLPGESRELNIEIINSPAARHEIDLWYSGDDHVAFSMCGPGVARTAVGPNARGVLAYEGRSVGRVYHRLGDPNNGDNEITIFLDADAPSGEWTLCLDGVDVVDGRYHAWIERAGASHSRFLRGEEVPKTTTGTIANGLRTISVGAYDAHHEDRVLAHFSSGGPTRNGRRKPDLVAPGVRVLSVRSHSADEIRADPPVFRMSGSSMASPCVAGTVALMFSAAPRLLSIQETRRLLLSNTQPPPQSDELTNARFGCGYLDVAAAVRAVLDVVAEERSRSALDSLLPDAVESSTTPEPSIIDASPRTDAMQSTPSPASPLASANTPSIDPLAGILPPDILTGLPATPAATELQCRCTCTPAPSRPAESALEKSAPFEPEADRSSPDRRQRTDNRQSNPGFQVQMPITGGTPALAVPFGGAASPFAFTIPLGGSATPAAPIVVSAAASSGPATTAPGASSTQSGGGDAPVSVAADEPLFVAADAAEDEGGGARACRRCGTSSSSDVAEDQFGEALMVSVVPTLEPSVARPKSSSDWLRAVLAAALDNVTPTALLCGPHGRLLSATSLFNAFVFPALRAVRQQMLLPQLSRQFMVVARPGDSAANLKLQTGDLLIRVSLGQGHSHVALLGSGQLAPHLELAARRLIGEGQPCVEPGLYAHVVERLPFTMRLADRFARRIADAQLRVLPDTLLLRAVAPPNWSGASGVTRISRIPDFAEQVPGPDSAVADRFIAANAARFCTPGQAGSATCSGLPTPRPIRRVIIHVLAVPSTARRSGVEAVVAGWQNPDRQAASHYLVDRDGAITQMVRESDVAFHTPGNNADSIGIEHADVCNDPSPLTDRLYQRSAELVRDIAVRNNFTADPTTVAGHSQVNPNHGDPGPYWDWEFYFQWLSWSGQKASRPCRRVAATVALPSVPVGWQLQHRRSIADDHCAEARDPWGETYWSATHCDANSQAAEVSLVLPETGTFSVSLWWPRAADANAAVLVDVEVACMQSPCIGASLQNVTVDQRRAAGQWNAVTHVTVTRAPSELKVRWHCPTAPGRVLADAVRALKIATPPSQPVLNLVPAGEAEEQTPAAPRSACAYFFKGSDYLRYGIGTDSTDFGPAPIASTWHFPAGFQSGIDAAVNWGNGKAYFFKGGQYLRYNIATDRVDVTPRAIYPAWPMPTQFRAGIHAAVNWGNGKVYFFKDAEYVRYDIASDAVDLGPTPIATGWPALPPDFQNGIQAAVNWGNGKTYFFKGDQYLRYDIANDQPDFAPRSIAAGWPALPAGFQSGLQAALNWTDPCDLAALFNSMGLSVVETAGWRAAGRSGAFEPVGIVMHHTGGNGAGDLATVINGRGATAQSPALPGPLANFYVARNADIHMIAAGKANHAGPGAQTVLQEVIQGITPSDTAAHRGLPDGPSGNGHFYGFECENRGDGVQGWPDVQLDAMARAAAALCQRHCWSTDHIISHAEWTSRKPDPRGFSMNDFRRRVASFF